MQLTNNFIYETAYNLYSLFNNNEQYIPVKLNFKIQKNLKTLQACAELIDEQKAKIGQQYGELMPEGHYSISPEKINEANKELMDLGNIVQDVMIQTISIDEIDENIKLTPHQMQAIMFMIEE